MGNVIVSGSFDDLNLRQVRLLEEAARLGSVHLLLWSDALAARLEGKAVKFPQEERRYYTEAIRFVDRVTLVEDLPSPAALPLSILPQPLTWVVEHVELCGAHGEALRDYCAANSIELVPISEAQLRAIPPFAAEEVEAAPGRKKVLVTGCYDWLHSGHVRFFEETSQMGDLYVAVGNDDSVRLLKGEGHPLFGQNHRRYMVQSIRYVKQAVFTSGTGWMDAGPEVLRIKPDFYVVNEDGDRPEKRAFCAEHGVTYIVLKRKPKEGLPPRVSTYLRGF